MTNANPITDLTEAMRATLAESSRLFLGSTAVPPEAFEGCYLPEEAAEKIAADRPRILVAPKAVPDMTFANRSTTQDEIEIDVAIIGRPASLTYQTTASPSMADFLRLAWSVGDFFRELTRTGRRIGPASIVRIACPAVYLPDTLRTKRVFLSVFTVTLRLMTPRS